MIVVNRIRNCPKMSLDETNTIDKTAANILVRLRRHARFVSQIASVYTRDIAT